MVSVSGSAYHLPDAAAPPPSAWLLHKDPQTRPCHLFSFAARGASSMESQTVDRKAETHQPGIEPGSHRGQRCILRQPPKGGLQGGQKDKPDQMFKEVAHSQSLHLTNLQKATRLRGLKPSQKEHLRQAPVSACTPASLTRRGIR